MPIYKVIAKGFFNGEFYDPNGKRSTLTTNKPFTKKNPMPSWLSEMPDEPEAVKRKRAEQEKSRKAAEKQAKKQAKEQVKEIAAASTEGEGESADFMAKGSSVETL